MMLSPIAALRMARELIANERDWTTGQRSVDGAGKPVSHYSVGHPQWLRFSDPHQVTGLTRFSTVGALFRATEDHWQDSSWHEAITALVWAVQSDRPIDEDRIHHLSSHAQALEAYDRAIAALLSKQGAHA